MSWRRLDFSAESLICKFIVPEEKTSIKTMALILLTGALVTGLVHLSPYLFASDQTNYSRLKHQTRVKCLGETIARPTQVSEKVPLLPK